MNDLDILSHAEPSPPQALVPSPDRGTEQRQTGMPRPRGAARWLPGLGVLFVVLAALGFGVWRHLEQNQQVAQTAQQQADFVPAVRVREVTTHDGHLHVTLPGTTLGFDEATIFGRASGYVLKRQVDIGDHVKAGQVLAEITAPEIDDQIAQYENSVRQAQATRNQNQAQQSLAQVTWGRDSVLVNEGWVTHQQGDTDRFTLQAQQHATSAAQHSAAAMQAQLGYYNQQKAYQQVVAPFDGVITQRNIDVGSLITADATSGTPMFSIAHTNVIRVWVYVPQDAALGVTPGIDATIHVPAMSNLVFHGKVTRTAEALQPGTRTLLTEIDIPNPDGTLPPGVYCTVELKIPRQTPALTVPASAIMFNQSGLQVAVVENGAARLRKISIANDYGTEVEVGDELKPGDAVVLQPPVDLEDGEKVQIIRPPPDANP